MRNSSSAITVLLVSLLLLIAVTDLRFAHAKKSGRSSSSASRGVSSRSSGNRGASSRASSAANKRPSSVKRKVVYEEEDVYDDDEEEDFDDEEDDFLGGGDFDEDDDEEEEEFVSSRRRPPTSAGRRPPPGSSRTARDAAIRASGRGRKRPPPARRGGRYSDDYEEDEYERPRPSRSGGGSRASGGRRGPPPQGGRARSSRGRVVPYTRAPAAPSTFTRGLDAIRNSMPDPETVKAAALNSIKAARETTSGLSANIYREVKGLTSSELEQVMLKATRPDDTPVKGKHVERLVGVTYQISARYDIYDAVLRKLWAKMAEKDWRTTVKALYILHRFSADGAPDHGPALKARLRELRRTRDPKRKDKYFNSKQLLAGDSSPESIKYRAFLSRYAHYVLLRTQCFGGMFDEIASLPKSDKKKTPKPITSTCLRTEHLDAAAMLLKAGMACQLKDGEECENTAIATERVASDMIGLTTAVAIALNRALKGDDRKGADPALLKKWCEFYKNSLQPQTRSMVKKTSPILDAYGLFLPSRMGTTVSPELLEKGLSLDESSAAEEESEESSPAAAKEDEDEEEEKDDDDEEEDEQEKEPAAKKRSADSEESAEKQKAEEDEVVDEEAQFDEEYEYDEEEYYDDEDDY